MSKIKKSQISDRIFQEMLGEFFSMVSTLKNKRELIDFFTKSLTTSEIIMISRRVQVAKRLMKGNSYQEMMEDMSVGASTIIAVSNMMEEDEGKYRILLEKYLIEKDSGYYVDKYKKKGLSKYPGYDLAVSVLGIDYLNKKVFNKK